MSRKKPKKLLQEHYSVLEEKLNVSVIVSKLFSKGVIAIDDHSLVVELQEKTGVVAARLFLNYFFDHCDDPKLYLLAQVMRESKSECPDHADLADLLDPRARLPPSESQVTENQPVTQLETFERVPQTIATGQISAIESNVLCSQISQVPTEGGITEVTRKDLDVCQDPGSTRSCSEDYSLQVPDFEIPQADAAQEYYDTFENVPESTREKPNPSTVMPDSVATFERATYKHPANIGEEENSDTSDESETEAAQGSQTPQSRNASRYIHHRPSFKPRDGQDTLTASQKQPRQQISNATKPACKDGNLPDPSQLATVCCDCWDDAAVRLSDARRGRCKHPKGKPLSVSSSPEKKEGCRPRTAASKLEFCKNPVPCFRGQKCHYAHGKKELDHWKASKLAMGCQVCLSDTWTTCVDLVNKTCLSPKHTATPTIIVYKDEQSKHLHHIRYPDQAQVTKGRKSNHSLENCGFSDPRSCQFPHSQFEEILWNRWKDKYYAKAQGPLLDPNAVERSPNLLKQFLNELKDCCTAHLSEETPVPVNNQAHKGTIMDVQDEKTLPTVASENAGGVLECTLSASNYKQRFHTLIQCEMATHEEFLKRCDGEYILTWYGKDDIRSDHQWHLALIMEQYIADNVRQAATHVILKYGKLSFKAGILPPQRFTKKGEPCLMIGFYNYENVPPFSSLRLLNAELKCKERLSIVAEFQLKYSYFNNLHKATDNLPNEIASKLTAEETGSDIHMTVEVPSKDFCFPQQFRLDDGQLSSCQKLLKCSPALPFIIVGPFGTGKTRVIAASAFWLLLRDRKSRILIAAHHRRTADEYIEKYFTEDLLNNTLGRVRAIRLLGSKAPVKDIRSNLVKKTWTAQSGLDTYRLIITTFITSMHMNNPGQFTHIFIDEGAQAREPECVAAFRFATPRTKIVIAGDHQQVGPRTSVLGEMARKYGLSVSLLERLHSLYNRGDMKEMSKSFQAVLLTNYRCHSAILSFPSTLFYLSSIKANAQDHPHPDWEFPLQFVCTSLQEFPQCTWASDKELQAAATNEIRAVKSLVQKCADNWPECWGEKKLSSLCVMVPTRFAEHLWKREVARTSLQNVTIAVTFDIQGLEYRAVFLCTSEPVNKDCTPFDPVKSLCDPRVFNTIITRSQSLVIAVGNPFRLMRIEQQMPEGNKHCWLSYFQCCWESGTLVLSNQMNQDRAVHSNAIVKFEKLIFDKKVSSLQKSSSFLQNPDNESTILSSYEDSFETMMAGHTDDDLSDNSGWDNSSQDNKRFFCKATKAIPKQWGGGVYRLKEISPECCLATSLGSSKPTLVISGVDDRRCAFDKATIQVAIRDEQRTRGVVFAVVKQGDTRPVVCVVDPKVPGYFIPVKQSSPKIVNTSTTTGLITCFDSQSLTVTRTFKVTDSIPLAVVGKVLFVVQPLSWNARERYPRGAAIAVIPRGTTLPLAEYLLQSSHGINLKARPLSMKDTPTQPNEVNWHNALAIVQPDGISSCAFSVDVGDGYFYVRVHVVNVVDSLSLPTPSSITAWHSVSGKCHRTTVQCSIIPDEVVRSLSFTGKKAHNAITLEMKVSGGVFLDHSRERILKNTELNIDTGNLTTSVITCELLPLADLQDIITSLSCGPVPRRDISKNPSLFDKVTLLHITAKKLHRMRLGHDGYSPFEIGPSGYPEAEKLENEFLVFANFSAAWKLSKNALLKRQYPHPGGKKEELALLDHMRSMPFHRLTAGPIQKPDPPGQSWALLTSVLKDVIIALRECQPMELKQCLWQLHHHPQFAVKLSAARELLSEEEFYVFDKSNADLQSHFIHHSPLYTSFTSPFQCFGDLFVQEGLLAAIRGTEWKRTTEELKYIANQCNRATSKALEYKNAMGNLELAISCQQSSVCIEAYVQQATDNALKLCYLPPNLPNSGTTRVAEVSLSKSMGKEYMVKIVAAEGLLRLHSWTKSEARRSTYGFIPKGSMLQRVGLQENATPLVVRLSQKMLADIKQCLDNIVQGPDLAKELEKLIPAKKNDSRIDELDHKFAFFRVPFPVQPYQVSRLWLGCDPTSYVLSVQPQCMELAPDVRVCLQHMQHPLTCFTQCPTEVASKLTYSSVSQYVKLWKDAILGASAMLGVSSTTSSLVYKNVLLKFPKFIIPPHILTQEMYTPVGDITASFEAESTTSTSDLFTIREGDLVCARYEVDLHASQLSHILKKYKDYIYPANGTAARAVLHMAVKNVVHRNKFNEVSFEVTGSHPSVSPLMKEILEKNKFTCELEVVAMPDSLRNSYQLLSTLNENTTKGSMYTVPIATGNLKQLQYLSTNKSMYLPYSENLAKKYGSYGTMLRGLSPANQRAINAAMNNGFQLIQTCPGMGGVRFANTLVFGFALRNKEEWKKGRSGGPQKCVLYCFPNEEMASEAAALFCKLRGVCNSGDYGVRVLRISDRKLERQHYSVPYYDDCGIFDGEVPERPVQSDDCSAFSLHHHTHATSSYSDQLKRWEDNFNKCCRGKNLPQLSDIVKYDQLTSKAEEEILSKSFDVIICTCSEASSERIRRYFQPVQVVVYNASMITEPETFSAIHQALHVALVGDHQQHHPLLSSDVSLQNGMNVSLFERMYRLIEREYSGDVEKCPLFVRLKEQEFML